MHHKQATKISEAIIVLHSVKILSDFHICNSFLIHF